MPYKCHAVKRPRHRLMLIFLFIITLIGTVQHVYASQPITISHTTLVPEHDRVEFKVIVNGVQVGHVEVVAKRDLSTPYSISIRYLFLQPKLSEAFRSPTNILVLVEYVIKGKFSGGNSYSNVILMEGLSGSKILTDIKGTFKYQKYIFDKFKIYVIFDVNGSQYIHAIDVLKEAENVGVEELYFIVKLDSILLDAERLILDPGWLEYRIKRGEKDIGRIRITAAPTFTNTYSIMIDYSVESIELADILGCSIELTIKSEEGGVYIWNYTLKAGDVVLVPQEGPEEIADISTFKITNFKVSIRALNRIIKILNVTEDVGVINVHRPQLKPIRRPLQILWISDLGNGWIEIYAATDLDLTFNFASAKFMPRPGSNKPLMLRVAILENAYNHTRVFKVLMYFVRGGEVRGDLVLEVSRPDVSKLTLYAPLSFHVKEGGKVSVKSVSPRYYVAPYKRLIELEIDRLVRLMRLGIIPRGLMEEYETKLVRYREALEKIRGDRVVLEVTLDQELSYYDLVLVEAVLNVSLRDSRSPLLVVTDLKVEDGVETTTPVKFRYWLNSSSTGRLYFKGFRGYKLIRLTLTIGYTKEFYRDHRVSDTNFIREAIVEFYNVKDVKVKALKVSIYKFSRPFLDPRVSVELGAENIEDYSVDRLSVSLAVVSMITVVGGSLLIIRGLIYDILHTLYRK